MLTELQMADAGEPLSFDASHYGVILRVSQNKGSIVRYVGHVPIRKIYCHHVAPEIKSSGDAFELGCSDFCSTIACESNPRMVASRFARLAACSADKADSSAVRARSRSSRRNKVNNVPHASAIRVSTNAANQVDSLGFLRTHIHARSKRVMGLAKIGRSVRNLRRSSAKSIAVAYRCFGSCSMAFMTMVSRSCGIVASHSRGAGSVRGASRGMRSAQGKQDRSVRSS